MTRFLHEILDDLDERQRAVVTAPRGPVRVLAGAGSGKTRALSRRVAHLVATGQARAKEVLAVSFTVRAAGELRERLALLDEASGGELDLGSARTSTFHAAAARQLAWFWPKAARPWRILEHKAALIARAADEAGSASAKLDHKEAQGEIEWAKASLVGPERYAAAAVRARRVLKSPPEAVAEVYRRYEALKAARSEQLLDFDDVLLAMVGVLGSSAEAADQVRSRCRCFLVDEFQDVTPLQHELLFAWLGTRDNLTVVGDPHQTVYSFAGASPAFFDEFARRFPHAASFRLDRDYRSTPQVTALANRLASGDRGADASVAGTLVGQRPAGPEPEFVEHADETAEAAEVSQAVAGLIARGIPAREIAVLFRANTHAARFERALRARGVPTGEGGVALCSLHGAKGLEWDAVFLVGLIEGVLPVGWATTADAIAEERRLLYVGITRARERLVLSWYRSSGSRAARPSRFIKGLIKN